MMEDIISNDNSEMKIIEFGSIPVDTVAEKCFSVENISDDILSYRVSVKYILNNIDRVFKISVTSNPIKPGDNALVKVIYRPTVPDQSYTDYYVLDDGAGNTYKITVTGQSFGPHVKLDKKQLEFKVCKNVDEQRRGVVNIINKSGVDTAYQWLMPVGGLGNFQISTGNCGIIRAFETISTIVYFTGASLGMYTAELVCLVMHQEPLYVHVAASVTLHGNPLFDVKDHVFDRHWKRKFRFTHLMENSLKRLIYIPAASVFDRFLDFGTGSAKDVTLNISQTLCVTNHRDTDGYIQWMSDPDNVFMIDPPTAVVPANESRLFTVRYRPKVQEEMYGYLLFGDYEYNVYEGDMVSVRHSWFRIPCIGNTWSPCTEWTAEWDVPTEVTLPPTVPSRTTFKNFMLANKLESPMYFKFVAPTESNFVVMPMCGIVPGRGWYVMSVALEPRSCGEYFETWDLVINQSQKTRVCLSGNAEISKIDVTSHGYNPATHGMFEFPPTITGCTNYSTAYFHNLTRMEIHLRILNNVSWLGADNCGTIVLPPKEIVRYQWWFFPREPDKVYETTITCTCVCLINGRPVGETSEMFIHIIGFSELPDLKVLPKTMNLHDIVVGENVTFAVTLYNYGSCYFTSKLFHNIEGMGDDHSGDAFEFDSNVNSLKPSTHCNVVMKVTPNGAGPRQITIKYTVLYRTEFDEVKEIMPVTKTILTVWYDGIYPTIKVKRTIAVICPIILSNHCVWNIMNIDEFNKALENVRPNLPLSVDIYAPDLCDTKGFVELILVLGCVYNVPVRWSLCREKICDCEMVEVQIGISMYEMRHDCFHRELVELSPLEGMVTPEEPGLINLKLSYTNEDQNKLCYSLSLPNQRLIYLFINICAHPNTKGILAPLRRPPACAPNCLAFLDCGRVPINNLDPVIRIVWLYNPSDVYTTWRLLRGNIVTQDSVIRCLLYFAEVPPLGKLAIPFAFMPTEMIDYKVTFNSSFGFETFDIKVIGQGGLPNCVETRLDIPYYMEKIIRAAYRRNVVYLSTPHITVKILPTHSLSRDIIAICNDTENTVRFIWLPERIPNIINIDMTPCWGVIHPKSTEWITMTVYTLQEPATFTTTVACEILDLTKRREYQRNELLRKKKMEKSNVEFIITESGTKHPALNDCPPYVNMDLKKPQPWYLTMTVSISSKGQRDGVPRMLLSQMWENVPPYDLLSLECSENIGKIPGGNNMPMVDIIRISDGILWEALHSKMFRNQMEYYAKEEIPTYSQLVKVVDRPVKPRLSRRVTSGICDAIVNKAIFHVYSLKPKHGIHYADSENI